MELNKKTKRFIAVEFLWLMILIITSFSILQIGNYLDDKRSEQLEAKEQRKSIKFERKKLWIVLCKNDLYFKGYEEFKKKYENTEDQIVLYNLCVNNALFTGTLSEFRVKYFTQECALEDCYSLYTGDMRLSEEYINYQSNDDWLELREQIQKFKTQLKKDSVFNVAYSLFVKDGYSGSEKQFKQLLFAGEDELVSDNPTHDNDLPIIDYWFQPIALKMVWIFVILLYPLRILVMLVRWSILQIREK